MDLVRILVILTWACVVDMCVCVSREVRVCVERWSVRACGVCVRSLGVRLCGVFKHVAHGVV